MQTTVSIHRGLPSHHRAALLRLVVVAADPFAATDHMTKNDKIRFLELSVWGSARKQREEALGTLDVQE